jgi:hypothetical protein
MILNCYKLAKYYAVAPDVFLRKPLSELNRDVFYTNRLIEEISATRDRS